MMPLAPFIILCVLSILGSVGNVFILAAVCLRHKLRVRGNMFVVNLALADLLVTAYIMPMGLVTSRYEIGEEDSDYLNPTHCQFNAFLILTTLGVSTQSLMMIALERYIHICQTRYYKKLLRPGVCVGLVIACWIYTSVWTCQGWTGWTRFEFMESMYVCIFKASASIIYNTCLAVFGIILPMVVISVSYYKIFKTVRSSREKLYTEPADRKDVASKSLNKKKKRKLQQEYRLITMLFTIVILFIIFWLPATLVLSLAAAVEMPAVLFTIAIWTAFCNSCVNSVVYGVMNRNFRAGYIALFRWMFCCGQSSNACSNERTSNEDTSTSHNNTNSRTRNNRNSTGHRSSIASTTAGSVASTEVSYASDSSTQYKNGSSRPIPMRDMQYQRQNNHLY